jgi:hypothetical protein
MATAANGGWMSPDGNIWDTQLEADYADCPAKRGPCPLPEQCEMRGCLRLDPPLFGRAPEICATCGASGYGNAACADCVRQWPRFGTSQTRAEAQLALIKRRPLEAACIAKMTDEEKAMMKAVIERGLARRAPWWRRWIP